MSSITYHLVASSFWESQEPRSDYAPPDFARAGFIHCTDDEQEMARVANLFYKSNAGPHVYLTIDKSRVHAPIRYEDAERRYPHIYGTLNRDAVVAVYPARRLPDGTFLPPEPLQNRK